MILDKILKYKREELENFKRRSSLSDLRKKGMDQEPARDFLKSLKNWTKSVRIIAEIKKASPSAGLIRPDFDPIRLAHAYEENGAVAVSVLTDEHFFQGSLSDLTRVKNKIPLPVLRKDFLFSEYQIYEARAAQADALLLIVRILEPSQLKDYMALTNELGMSPLVEVHDEKEFEAAQKVGAALIGINNRDLDSLKIDLGTTEKILSGERDDRLTVLSESGISKREEIEKLLEVGVHGFLIGEALLKEKDPGEKLRELWSL
ncbi:MAG: indole-3-glycerol phosphate synthase TrpC [bacterium]|nr:indole-3-glycerol phosphate synthase TrpC [bacterium]